MTARRSSYLCSQLCRSTPASFPPPLPPRPMAGLCAAAGRVVLSGALDAP